MDRCLNFHEKCSCDGLVHWRMWETECQSVILLGKKNFFKGYDTLESRYYLDVSGLALEVKREGISFSITSDSFKGVDVKKLTLPTCPEVLVRVAKTCEQIALLFPVRGIDAPIMTERPGFFHSGPYCLALGPLLLPQLHVKNQRRKKQNCTCGNLQNDQYTVERKISDQVSLMFSSLPHIPPLGTPQLPQISLPLLHFEDKPSLQGLTDPVEWYGGIIMHVVKNITLLSHHTLDGESTTKCFNWHGR